MGSPRSGLYLERGIMVARLRRQSALDFRWLLLPEFKVGALCGKAIHGEKRRELVETEKIRPASPTSISETVKSGVDFSEDRRVHGLFSRMLLSPLPKSAKIVETICLRERGKFGNESCIHGYTPYR